MQTCDESVVLQGIDQAGPDYCTPLDTVAYAQGWAAVEPIKAEVSYVSTGGVRVTVDIPSLKKNKHIQRALPLKYRIESKATRVTYEPRPKASPKLKHTYLIRRKVGPDLDPDCPTPIITMISTFILARVRTTPRSSDGKQKSLWERASDLCGGISARRQRAAW